MKKILNFILHRLFIVAILLLLQIVFLILILTKFQDAIPYFYIAMDLIGIIVLLEIINNKANPNYKIAWIIPILTIPIFGVFFYLVFGTKPDGRIDKRTKIVKQRLDKNLIQDDEILNKIKQDNMDAYNQALYLSKNKFPVYNNTNVQYF